MQPRPEQPRVRLGTGVLVVSPEERLQIVQQEHDGVADWGPLGGALEEGESIEACALREAYEESGLRVKLRRLLSVEEFWHAGRIQGVGFVFLAEPDPWPQAVTIPAFDGPTRFLDYRWVTKEEAPRFAPNFSWEFWARYWPLEVHHTVLRKHEFPR
jgi:ADP-ribose pyrophosphatase YjhB (NUDIX family)